jgi:hypothetical protein
MEEDFPSTVRYAWLSSPNRLVHAGATNLAGTLKRWCKKKKPLSQQWYLLVILMFGISTYCTK